MSSFVVNFSIRRTNPLVLRQLQADEGMSVSLLAESAARSLGLQITAGTLLEGETAAAADQTLSCFLKPGASYSLLLTEKGAEKEPPLRLTADVLPDMAPEIPGKLPRVLLAMGLNPPQGITDPGAIIQLHRDLSSTAASTLNGELYSRNSLSFVPKRFDNAILKLMDPDNAPAEINMALGQPMSLILNQLKMIEIKDIAKANEVYYYNPIRKAELIDLISERVSDDFILQILSELTCAAYERFRKLPFGNAIPADDLSALHVLREHGLAGEFNGEPVLATELLEYFDHIAGSSNETAFLLNQQLTCAMNACLQLYTIFDTQQFIALAKIRTNGAVSRQQCLGYWHVTAAMDSKPKQLLDGVFYNNDRLNRSQAASAWNKLQQLPRHFRPDIAAMDLLEEQGLHLPQPRHTELRHLIHAYHFLFYKSTQQVCACIISLLSMGIAPQDVVNKMPRSIFAYSYHKQEFAGALVPVLEAVRMDVPLMSLGGYSVRSWQDAGFGRLQEKR